MAFPVYLSSPLSSRNQFGGFLNELGMTGKAIEIGCHQGEFSKIFIRTWEGEKLYCIDPYSNGYDQDDPVSRRSFHERRRDKEDWRKVTEEQRKRCLLIEKPSATAINLFTLNSVDFIYIDGNHQYHAVSWDIANWWKILRPGGVLAGHDWICPGEVNGGHGRAIQRALADFLSTIKGKEEYPVQLIVEENGFPWTWYLRKE